ncbi:tail protein [Bacillus phage vB_BanS_Skywalker]|uniref:Platelet endothelial cell adhesion molecule n=2 Tax=Tsamsavirus TaxID=3044849 RepID=A0AAE8YVB3_9CAUD|nr:tail protein [Bacillus phage vB_BanS_Skywalker]YP_010681090.1 tail protein [Bacillus phage vB_BanS_MrDarsey]UGO48026.1 platelet endothelial cell adhesion molecule [Bacillus phage vB_BanS_MrDarsey]UGO51232.1 platelet endothelial cell adhesion molecule [Bacillus phage vB_BanS_Skywalker]
MAIVASGQLTLVDLNDSKQLIMFIGSSQQRQVIYNPTGGTYVPNYSTANNVLTPQLFVAGTNADVANQATSTKWFVQTNSTGTPTEITASTTDYTLGTGTPKTLTIKNNVLASNNSMTYICEMQFLDTDTGFTVTSKAEYEIVKVTNGSNGQDSIRATVWTPDGNTIKNANGTLKAKCDLYVGSAVQSAGVTYKWYYQDPTSTIANGGSDTAGGDGWRLMKDTASANGVTGYNNTNTITIPASAIMNVESFKCVATYSTKNYADVCTVIDVSDPFMVTIVGINTFKNGVGTTSLTARIYQAGAEVDSAGTGGYTYTWYLYDNNNNKITTWNTTGSKTGKTITVDGADVTVRGNIICEVSK